jgi:hypothetical protein
MVVTKRLRSVLEATRRSARDPRADTTVRAVLAKEGVHVPVSDLFGVTGQRLLDEVSLGRTYKIRVDSEVGEHTTRRLRALCCKAFCGFTDRCGGEVGELPGDQQLLRLGFIRASPQPHPDRVLMCPAWLVRSVKLTPTPAARKRRSFDALRHVVAVNNPEGCMPSFSDRSPTAARPARRSLA